jgi:hypothetical protein
VREAATVCEKGRGRVTDAREVGHHEVGEQQEALTLTLILALTLALAPAPALTLTQVERTDAREGGHHEVGEQQRRGDGAEQPALAREATREHVEACNRT